MRKTFLYLLLMFAVTLSASAQAAEPAIKGWTRVQAMAPGTKIHVQAKNHWDTCKLKSADADSLTCELRDGAKTEVFQKSDIQKVAVAHRGRSALIGLAAGAGVGTGIGYGIGKSQETKGGFINLNSVTTGFYAAITGIGLALIGAIVGAMTDFAGSTIYKA